VHPEKALRKKKLLRLERRGNIRTGLHYDNGKEEKKRILGG